MTDTIKVTIDADLKEIIPGYLDNRQQDIRAIKEALIAKDYETIRLIGHTMKGSGASYGFDMISDIGRSIEEAAIAEGKQTIEKKTEALTSFLEQVHVKFVQF